MRPRAATIGAWMPPARRTAAALVAPLLTGACAGAQSALDPAGAQAADVRALWWLMLAVSAVVFLGVTGFLALALLRRERGRAGADDARARPWVAGAVILSVVLLVVLFVGNLVVSRSVAGLAGGDDAWRIHVTGHQWWWDVRYEREGQASLGVRTANEIHLPAGQSVELRLRARDVIHSLWLPNIHGKLDLVPGRNNAMWIRAERPGVYRGQCAEYCGLQHARMALVVIVHEPAEFEAWLAHQRRPAAEPASALAAEGREVFLASACASCHTVRGTRAHATVGPDLTHLASRRTLAAGTVPNVRGWLAGWIADPQSLKPGNHMPAVPLSADQLHALLAWLEGLE